MKRKIIGILIMTLLIITVIPVVGTMNKNENIFQNNFMISNSASLFMQLPTNPDHRNIVEWASGKNWEYKNYEKFIEVTSQICSVQWWGQYMLEDGGTWTELDPEDMFVDITFYEDADNAPGDLVLSYYNVKPVVTPTGIWYDWYGSIEQMIHFQYDLDDCCDLSEGWVSIESISSEDNGIFLWMNSQEGDNHYYRDLPEESGLKNDDLSIVLTDGETATPDLECSNDFNWIEITPGSTVEGNFEILNNGDPGSILHWKISEYPEWGTNWTFIYKSGYLSTENGYNVNFEFSAPNEKNSEYTGNIKLINTFDENDFVEISLSLATPKSKFNIHSVIMNYLQSNYPLILKIINDYIY